MADVIFLKDIVNEDLSHYKEPVKLLVFPYCSFKCGEACHNKYLSDAQAHAYYFQDIVHNFLDNSFEKAICLAGLEPLDSPVSVLSFVKYFRSKSDAPIILYTGYEPEEIKETKLLSQIIEAATKYGCKFFLKTGRYIPDCEPYESLALGVTLASGNQQVYTFEGDSMGFEIPGGIPEYEDYED